MAFSHHNVVLLAPPLVVQEKTQEEGGVFFLEHEDCEAKVLQQFIKNHRGQEYNLTMYKKT
jgi:ribosomal protein L10